MTEDESRYEEGRSINEALPKPLRENNYYEAEMMYAAPSIEDRFR